MSKLSKSVHGLLISSVLISLLTSESVGQTSDTPLPPAPRPLPSAEVTSRSEKVTSEPEPTTGRIRPVSAQPGPNYIISSVKLNEPQVGYYLGVFGGISLFQDDVFEGDGGKVTVNGSNTSYGDSLSPMAGLKFGYLWPFDEEPIDQFDAELGGAKLRLSGGLEVEAFYLNNELDLSIGGSTDSVLFDSAVVMTNFYLMGQVDSFRVYGGGGIGFASIWVSNYDNGGSEEDDATTFAYKGFIGTEYMISSDIGLFSEFQYLGFYEADFFSGTASLSLDNFEQMLLSVGVKKYF